MAELSLDNIFTADEAELLFAEETPDTPLESSEKSTEEEDKGTDKKEIFPITGGILTNSSKYRCAVPKIRTGS